MGMFLSSLVVENRLSEDVHGGHEGGRRVHAASQREESVSKPKSPDEEEKPMHDRRLANPTAKCPYHPKKDWRLLVRQAWDYGWWCEPRRDGILCFPPDGTKDAVHVPMNPGQARNLGNTKRRFARAGLPM
jgi:hypothetical protein